MRGAILKVIKYIVGSILPNRRRRIKKTETEDRWNCYVGEEGEENEWSFKTRYPLPDSNQFAS